MLENLISRLSSKSSTSYIPLQAVAEGDDEVNEGVTTAPRSRFINGWYSRARWSITRHALLGGSLFTVACVAYLAFTSRSSTGAKGPRFPDMHEPYPGIWEHNDAVASHIERCRALNLIRPISSPLSPGDRDVLESAGCSPNSTTIILLADEFFASAYRGDKTGEAVWSYSTMISLKSYGYSYMFSSQGYWDWDMTKTLEIYQRYRDRIPIVLAGWEQVEWCYSHSGCLQDENHPDGIEPWKLLGQWYWDSPKHPLGPRFTISPSNRSSLNRYLPYTIAPTCLVQPFIPHDIRPLQGYIFAKEIAYFAKGVFAWTFDALKSLRESDTESLNWVAGIKGNPEMIDLYQAVKDAGIRNVGRLEQEAFYRLLGESRVMLGVGMPKISPSPWDALCLGVPFINPIMEWDQQDPADQSKWKTQQWRMDDIEPPYVYTVHAQDTAGLHAAIRQALINPINRYIPPRMQFEYVRDVVAELVNWDWKAEYRLALHEQGLE